MRPASPLARGYAWWTRHPLRPRSLEMAGEQSLWHVRSTGPASAWPWFRFRLSAVETSGPSSLFDDVCNPSVRGHDRGPPEPRPLPQRIGHVFPGGGRLTEPPERGTARLSPPGTRTRWLVDALEPHPNQFGRLSSQARRSILRRGDRARPASMKTRSDAPAAQSRRLRDPTAKGPPSRRPPAKEEASDGTRGAFRRWSPRREGSDSTSCPQPVESWTARALPSFDVLLTKGASGREAAELRQPNPRTASARLLAVRSIDLCVRG